MTDYFSLIKLLAVANVEFIIVGGAAATAHGSTRLTEDLDVVYKRDSENIRKLVKALTSIEPYPRDAPAGLPFKWDEATVSNGLNFTLRTSLGPLDLFGEITLGGSYEKLLPHSIELEIRDGRYLCLGLKRLIEVKRAAGRAKDLAVAAELETILQEQRNQR
jgi:hypothetical protein